MARPQPASTQSRPAADFGIPALQAEQWLQAIDARHLPPSTSARDRRRFRSQLHLNDLMLARACALGRDAAWETLWTTYQPRLRAAALRLTRDSESARELADNLLGDLFGLRGGSAEQSKLWSYHGLGSLDAWLCTLLAQSHINQWRRHRRQVSLDAGLEDSGSLCALLVPPNQEAAAAAAEFRPLAAAVAAALVALAPDVRLLLSLYFVDGHTLNQIAGLLRVHESTISRRLTRQLQRLRREVRRQLEHQGLRPAVRDAVLRNAASLEPGWLHVDVSSALRPSAAPRNAHGA